VSFGDVRWSDYDFTVDLMRVKGNGCAYLHFRDTGRSGNLMDFEISSGDRDEEDCRVTTYMDGEERNLGGERFHLVDHKWYTAGVRVHGGLVECTLHDGEKEVVHLEAPDNRHRKGQVGLGTHESSFRFRNIRVTAQDNRLLWNGPPNRLVNAQGKVLWEAP
jgi:hypothetical protein